MPPTLEIDSISPNDFESVLQRYESHIPSNLKDLETVRLRSVPKSLESRRHDQESKPWLEKKELEQLVEWKLKHGTYRPKLAQLVASNDAKDVRKTTEEAFSLYEEDEFDKVLPLLTKLKGVGPATASLVLACYDPVNVPFFSDELFRWAHWDGRGNGIKNTGQGFKRSIGYTAKEYKSLCGRVSTARKRLSKEGREETSALEMEKVAYVLGKEGVDVAQIVTEESKSKKMSDVSVEKKGNSRKRKNTRSDDKDTKRPK